MQVDGYNSNKAKQTDSVHGVRLVVSPRLNFTTRQTPHTLRLFAALAENNMSNLERYRKDLEALIRTGDTLHNAMQHECFPDETLASLEKSMDKKAAKKFVADLPNFHDDYQNWYSEAKALVKQLLL